MTSMNILQENQRADAFTVSHVPAALAMQDDLKSMNLTFFHYNKIVEDKKYLNIFSLHQLFRDRFGYTHDEGFFDRQMDNFKKNNKFSLWQSSFADDPCMDYFRQLNINHGITLYRQHNTYKETFHFATTNDNPQILNFYINNLDILDSLADTFVDRMGDILTPTSDKLVHVIRGKNVLQPEVYLTPKERQCLELLKKGYTNKQMAFQLGNSPRTIEEVVSSIMRKFKVTSRQDFVIAENRLFRQRL